MDFGSALFAKINTSEWNDDIVCEWLRLLKAKLRAKSVTQEGLVRGLREAGARLQDEHPLAFPLLNVIHRVVNLSTNPGTLRKFRAAKNLTNILSDLHSTAELPADEPDVGFEDLADELLGVETDAEEIAVLAQKHLQPGELVMVYASSRLMEAFARRAAERPGVSLLIVKNTLSANSAAFMPEALDNYAVIPDSSAPAFMHRVGKLFTDAFAVLADGSLLHDAGLFALCLAAQECAVPVVVLAPLHRFTPLYAFGQETFNAPVSPLAVWPALRGQNGVDVLLLRHDHVPAECVRVVVSQAGEFPPAFVHRALAEYYGCGELGYGFR